MSPLRVGKSSAMGGGRHRHVFGSSRLGEHDTLVYVCVCVSSVELLFCLEVASKNTRKGSRPVILFCHVVAHLEDQSICSSVPEAGNVCPGLGSALAVNGPDHGISSHFGAYLLRFAAAFFVFPAQANVSRGGRNIGSTTLRKVRGKFAEAVLPRVDLVFAELQLLILLRGVLADRAQDFPRGSYLPQLSEATARGSTIILETCSRKLPLTARKLCGRFRGRGVRPIKFKDNKHH